MQLALIITLARRAFSDVYPVIKLDLRLLVARYLLFSTVAPGFVLSISLRPTVPLLLIRSLYHDAATLEAVGIVIISMHCAPTSSKTRKHARLYITHCTPHPLLLVTIFSLDWLN